MISVLWHLSSPSLYTCCRRVLQSISVDRPKRKQRAHRDWNSSRCFSWGSVVACWLEFALLYRFQLCESIRFPPAGYPLQIFIIHKDWGNTVGLALIWKIQLYITHMLKEHDGRESAAEIGRDCLWLLESYGRIHFNISLHRSESASNTPPTHVLHLLQKHHPRTTVIRNRGTQQTQYEKVVILYYCRGHWNIKKGSSWKRYESECKVH